MGYSSLCKSIHGNPSYNHSSGRAGCRICKITPHHMCAVWSGERCAESFDVRGRNASSNYCIGVGGEIVGCVDESDRSWCSASSWNDNRAITIEVANSSLGGDYPISAASWDALVSLCVDICRRHGFRLTYDGTRDGTLTEHRMFASTDCPGPYLHRRMGELAEQVNALLDSGGTAPSSGTSATGFGGTYRCTIDGLNIRCAPSTGAEIDRGATYDTGETVVLDDWYTTADGYVWGRYATASGATRYVAVGRATGRPEADDYLVRVDATPYVVRVAADELNVRTGPGTDNAVATAVHKGDAYTIVEEADGAGASRWGRLKSGAGWVALDHVEKV